MNIIKRRKIFFVLNGFLFVLFLLLSIYYLENINNNYIGIRVQRLDGNWYIKRIQYDGSAYGSVLSVGDKIVSIDNKAPEDNKILKSGLLLKA